MKKIFFSIVIIVAGSCETSDNELNNDFQYGKFLYKTKQLSKIIHNDNLLHEFKYDSLNRLAEMNIYNLDSIIQREKYLYNSKNQIIERQYGDFTEYFKYQNELLKEKYCSYEKNSEWNPKTIYFYNNNKEIIKADNYFNDNLVGSIDFEYDEKGNTILRSEYNREGDDNLLITEYKYKYDDYKNPTRLINLYPIDLIQKNNVIYSYYYNINMLMFPPEYSSTFLYDNEGFPIEEYRYYKNRYSDSIPEKYTYIYLE